MKEDFLEKLRNVGLHGTAENWGLFSENEECLTKVIQIEETFLKQKRYKRLFEASGITHLVPMSTFDWKWPKSIQRNIVESCLCLDNLKEKRNVIIIGPQGVGKTMIAQNIAMNAIQRGIKALVITASALLSRLSAEAAKPNAAGLDRAFKKFASVPLLVIDEIGYISYAASYGDLLFQLISLRHEKSSTVITTNIKLSQWNQVFPNTNSLAPMVDRLVQHSEIIKIEGPSWRTKDRVQQPQNAASEVKS
jgi:DNA replication protein DnaC